MLFSSGCHLRSTDIGLISPNNSALYAGDFVPRPTTLVVVEISTFLFCAKAKMFAISRSPNRIVFVLILICFLFCLLYYRFSTYLRVVLCCQKLLLMPICEKTHLTYNN